MISNNATPVMPKPKHTIEEYIELELRSEAKYEYFDGFVVERSPRTFLHIELMMNAFRSLSNKLDRQNYEVFPSALRLKVPAAFPYHYPDISVICGEPIRCSDKVL
jgi:Uma2 family endonuclease